MNGRAIAFAFSASVLAGCATPRTVVVPLADQVPASLLTCAPRPVPGRADRQSDVARYVVELDVAGADCRRKILAIKGIVDADTASGDAGRGQ